MHSAATKQRLRASLLSLAILCAVLALWHVLTLKPEQALPPGMTAEYAAMMGKGAEKTDQLITAVRMEGGKLQLNGKALDLPMLKPAH